MEKNEIERIKYHVEQVLSYRRYASPVLYAAGDPQWMEDLRWCIETIINLLKEIKE